MRHGHGALGGAAVRGMADRGRLDIEDVCMEFEPAWSLRADVLNAVLGWLADDGETHGQGCYAGMRLLKKSETLASTCRDELYQSLLFSMMNDRFSSDLKSTKESISIRSESINGLLF